MIYSYKNHFGCWMGNPLWVDKNGNGEINWEIIIIVHISYENSSGDGGKCILKR